MAAAKGLPFNMADRTSKRYSVSALYSMAAEQDEEVEDELAREQRSLRDLKSRISSQSKRNFILERDVRYLDSRIALLIQNRMALHEQQEVASHLEESEHVEGGFPDDRKKQHYGNLFFLLQAEPRHIAHLTRLVTLSEIDTLLQTVMFTLYGNQYESREEHLLLTMFQGVLSAQFETATDFGSLLRANTPVSRMMTTYTRRGPGQTYLKHVLSDSINKLIEDRDTDLEINPLKVYERMVKDMEDRGEPCDLPRGVSGDMAAENEDVQKIIAPRLDKLMDIANSFLDTILASIGQVPYGIRWICKQIRSLTKRRYPNATEYSVCSLIGGFFFLRFINPAIVTPNAYMLVDGTPEKNPRRTLTLMAKMLQNLANKPSYSKEIYMIKLNPFVEDNKQRINKFLNELCEVGDFYESLEMDQYMALSKKDISLSITLNEVYNTHALLEQHLDELAPSESEHLRIILSELGQAPVQVSRAENKTIELALFSRWETPINDMNIIGDNNLSQNDILFMETKSIFVQLLRSMPQMARKNIVLAAVAEAAATSKDATLVRKGIKVADMLRELEELGVVNRMDNYKLLTEEVKQELVHLGNLRDKVCREIASLESVYKTICDHNTYLRSQLDSYKAYLQNVRLQSSGLDLKKKSKSARVTGPVKFTHMQLEKDGVIIESNVPENRRSNIYFNIMSPSTGTFVISLHYKGREKAILEMDLKLDDLLEKQQDNVQLLDLEYVQLNVARLLALLNKTFMKN
ncbi:Rho GTPase activation protein [Syncephalis pseudoplumigaleata]|uniref:Rho GTPase activation protein n=1 Tax=Syncephalis pseudoplumigaleata TaxID=1712513 RepID=A0A4P9Z1Y7_9FUNG|nr:Rho GTPase activation protein [Syncephalis pseudoplumigaleata]|eukprot:RKP25982.1 Rho GTPase activation protein [Syncephalis pseudoplumigaleata]